MYDLQQSWHNPQVDAIYSMKLYLLYDSIIHLITRFRNCSSEELNIVRSILVRIELMFDDQASQPRLPSFSQQMKKIDNVDLKRNGACSVLFMLIISCRTAVRAAIMFWIFGILFMITMFV